MTRVQVYCLCLTKTCTFKTESVQVSSTLRILIYYAVKINGLPLYKVSTSKNELHGPESFFENYSFFRDLRNSPQFTEDEGTFQCSREPSICICPQPVSSVRFPSRTTIMHFNIILSLLLGFKRFSSSSVTHNNPVSNSHLPRMCHNAYVPHHTLFDHLITVQFSVVSCYFCLLKTTTTTITTTTTTTTTPTTTNNNNDNNHN